MSRIKKNFWQCADSDVKWHPDPAADAAGLGWGLRGPRSFSFDGKQLSYPIMHYYDSHLPSLPCPIQAGWKTSGHHGNSAESVATPWKSETRMWLSSVMITIPRTAVAVLLSSPESWQKLFTSIFLPHSVLFMYLDTYSLERVSMATGSLDSTTSRSNLQSVWHCVSDSFRCFEGQNEDTILLSFRFKQQG